METFGIGSGLGHIGMRERLTGNQDGVASTPPLQLTFADHHHVLCIISFTQLGQRRSRQHKQAQ